MSEDTVLGGRRLPQLQECGSVDLALEPTASLTGPWSAPWAPGKPPASSSHWLWDQAHPSPSQSEISKRSGSVIRESNQGGLEGLKIQYLLSCDRGWAQGCLQIQEELGLRDTLSHISLKMTEKATLMSTHIALLYLHACQWVFKGI